MDATNIKFSKLIKRSEVWGGKSRQTKQVAVRNTALDLLREKRQKKFLESQKPSVAHKSGYITKVVMASLAEKNERKIEARKHFQLRWTGRKNLTNLKYGDLTPVQRLAIFNRHHKCPCHGLRYNTWKSVKTPQCEKVVFGCDRKQRPDDNEQTYIGKCSNCQREVGQYTLTRVNCMCSVNRCMFCLFETYDVAGKLNIICHCGHVNDRKHFEAALRQSKTWKSKSDRKAFFSELKGEVKEEVPVVEAKVEQIVEEVKKLAISSKPKPKRKNWKLMNEYLFKEKTEVHGGAVSALNTGIDAASTAFLVIFKKIKGAFKESIDKLAEWKTKVVQTRVFFKILTYFENLWAKLYNLMSLICAKLDSKIFLVPAFISLLADFFYGHGSKLRFVGLVGLIADFLNLDVATIFAGASCSYNWITDFIGDWLEATIWTRAQNAGTDAEAEKVQSHGLTDGTLVNMYSNLMQGIAAANNLVGFRMKDAMEGCRSFNTLFSGVRNIGSLLGKFVSFFPECIQSLFMGSDPRYYLAEQLRTEGSYLHTMSVLATSVQVAIFNQDAESVNKWGNSYEQIRKLYMADCKTKGNAPTLEVLRYIKECDGLASTRGWKKKTCIEPFVVRTAGDSGVGKSTYTMAFSSACYPDKTAEELDTITYPRNPLGETWDGCIYERHKICVLDDYNQDREEADLREMILMCSRPAYYAPFASIAFEDKYSMGLKGDILNFQVIIANGNTTKLNPSTLNSAEAINRRKDIMFDIRFLPGHTEVLDDFSHASVARLGFVDGEDYRELWRMEGALGLERAVYETSLAFLKKKRISEKIMKATDSMLFKNIKPDPSKWGAICESNLAERLVAVNEEEQEHSKKRAEEMRMKRAVIANEFALTGKTPTESHGFSLEEIMGDFKLDEDYLANHKLFKYAIMGASTGIGIILGNLFMRGVYGYGINWKKAFYSCSVASAVVVGLAYFQDWMGSHGKAQTEVNSGEATDRNVRTKTVVHAGATMSLAKSWSRNCFKLAFEGENHTNGIFVRGNVALLNAHLFWETRDGNRVFKRDGSKMMLYSHFQKEPMVIPFESKRLRQIKTEKGERDLVLYQFHNIVTARPTILKHFWDGSVKLGNRKIVSLIHKWDSLEFHHGTVVKDMTEAVYTTMRNGVASEIEQHMCGVINVPSVAGDCGSLVMVDDDFMAQKIVGVNIGACRGTCSTTLYVTRGMLEDTLDSFEDVFERAEMHSGWSVPTDEDYFKAKLEGVLSLYAVSDKSVVPVGKSKIRESPLYGLITPAVTSPCIVNMKDPRLKENTYLAAMNKYGTLSKAFPLEHIEEAGISIVQDIRSVKSIRLNRILTQHEAINGVVGYPYLDSLDMTTSPGFPFTTEGITGEKRVLFEGEVGNLRPIARLQYHIDVLLERLKKGILPDYPYTTALKDERKPIADVEAGKVRMFAMNNVALAIVMRMYLLPTVAHLYQCRHDTFLAVGIDKSSSEWDSMVRYLLEVSPLIADADYKKFDTRAQLDCRMAINKVFLEPYLQGEDVRIVKTVLQYDSQALFQYYKYIIALASGTSSGSILTVLVNSLINEMYIRCAWKGLAPVTLRDLKYFKQFVRTKNYGDDLAISCHPTVEQFFSDERIAEYFSLFDITLTPGSKSGDWGHKTYEHFSFLKNKTRMWEGRYVPLMQEYAEPINWIRIGLHAETPEVACENNCNSVLRAVFFYGKKEYDALRDKILALRPAYNLLAFSALYEEYKQMGKLCDVEGTFTFGAHRMSVASILNAEADGRKNLPLIQEEFELIDLPKMDGPKSYDSGKDYTEVHGGEVEEKAEEQKAESNKFREMREIDCLRMHFQRALLLYSSLSGEKYNDDLKYSRVCATCKKAEYCCDHQYEHDILAERCFDCFVGNCDCSYDAHEVFMLETACDLKKVTFSGLNRDDEDRLKSACLRTAESYGKRNMTTSRLLYLAGVFVGLGMHTLEANFHSKKEEDEKEQVESHAGEEEGTLDEAVAIVDEKAGVLLSQQAAPMVISRAENRGFTLDKRAEAYNDDVAWDLQKMLNRWNFVANVTWAATDAVGSFVATFDVLQDLLNNAIGTTPFLRFEKFRCKRIRIHAEVIGYRYMRGRVLVVHRNTMLPKAELGAIQYSLKDAITLAHVSLDPSAGTTTVLDIPFTFNKQYLDLVNGDSLGQVSVIVQNQLVPGTGGDSTAIIKLYMSVDEPVFKQPRPGATTFRNAMRAERTIIHGGPVEELVQAGTSAVTNLVKDLAPEKLINDFLGGILDRVQIGENISPLVHKDQQYMSNLRNIDYTEYLSADPSAQQMSDPEVFSANVNEMLIDEIIKKKAGFIGTFKWQHVDPLGKVLFSENVGPMASFPISFNPAAPSEVVPLDLVASMFTYWRGGITYIIELVGTPFHEGKIDLNFHPSLTKTTTDAFTANNSVTQYSKTHFMRNAGNIVAVKCPYLGDTPVKLVWNGEALAETPGVPNTRRFIDCFAGSFEVRVSTILNAPNTVSPDIEFNVYKLASDDFEFFMNTLNNSSVQFVTASDELLKGPERVVVHSGNLDRNQPFDQMKPDVLSVGPGEASDIGQSHFGEYFKSLRDMCKRYQRYTFGTFETDLTDLSAEQKNGTAPILLQFKNQLEAMNNYIGKVSNFYRMYRGPLCLKVKLRGGISAKDGSADPVYPITTHGYIIPLETGNIPLSASSIKFFPAQPSALTGVVSGNSLPFGYASTTTTAEVKIPFLFNKTAALVQKPWDLDITSYYLGNFYALNFAIAAYLEGIPFQTAQQEKYVYTLTFEISVAFGDESSFGVWVGMPLAYIATREGDPTRSIEPDQWVSGLRSTRK